jgi:RND family efflux transporter MFP subunit
MNRTKVTVGLIAVLIVIVGILLYNKSRMEARSKNDSMTAIPVSTVQATKQKIAVDRSLVGTIAANNDVPIIAETQGRVTKVLAEVGQYRPAGAVLMEVDDELKKAAFATAEVNYEKAKRDLARFEALGKQDAATEQQVESARLAAKAAEAQFILARREYHDTKITTPIAGIVTSRVVDLGGYVQKNAAVANVVDISMLKVKLNVAERDVFKLRVGDKVLVTTDVYPGVTFEGTIRTISDKSDESHTYPVEVRLPNSSKHPLKAGMFGRVAFTSIPQVEAVTIPREALVGSMKNAQVFVVDGDVARLRNIVVGSEFGAQLTALDGITAGETVVVNGQNNLKDNIEVAVVK